MLNEKNTYYPIIFYMHLKIIYRPSIQSTAQIINKLVKFDEVLIIDATKNEVIDGLEAPWYKIQFDDGTIGWVFGGYVKIYLWEDEIEEINSESCLAGTVILPSDLTSAPIHVFRLISKSVAVIINLPFSALKRTLFKIGSPGLLATILLAILKYLENVS